MDSNKLNYAARTLVFVTTLLLTSACARAQSHRGNFSSYSRDGSAITVKSGKSILRFVFYRPNLVRVEYLPTRSSTISKFHIVIRKPDRQVNYSVINGDSTLSIATSSLRIACRKFPLRVSFFDRSGRLLTGTPKPGGISSSNGTMGASFSITRDEHFYGTGERGMSLDLRGLAFDSFNEQHGGYPTGGIPPTMNVNIPFIVSSNHYGIYFDDTYEGHFDIGHSDPCILGYTAYGGRLSYYFIYDSTYGGILHDYTWLTGRAPLLPKWAYGYIQSKFGYRDSAQASQMINRMRRDNIPCDAIVLDLYWFRDMGDLSWNTAAWPDPNHVTSSFLSRGFKTIVITEPYIVRHSKNFQVAERSGYFAKDSVGKSYLLAHFWACGCDAGLVDITNPAVCKWWWKKYRHIFDTGVSGIWTDLAEPERDYPEMIFYDGPDMKIHNIYDFLWAKTIFDGYNRSFPNRRLFNLTRSGYAGIQRFGAVTWSGDVAKTFHGLAVQLPILLDMGMSGMAYHNSDIGGFTGDRPTASELYIRWLEFGAFCPVMRAHGYDGLGGTEPWAFGDSTEKVARRIIDLRYSLLPYNYTMAHEAYTTGLPLARPLMMSYPEDPRVANESSAYMWGDDFLVAPVVRKGQTTKKFYLPDGKWVDYWTDSVYTGGATVTVPAPLDQVPLFVKLGSIIPMEMPEAYVGQYPADTIMLSIYPDPDLRSSFNLYEDDGSTQDYQHGESSETPFKAEMVHAPKSEELKISIGVSSGNYRGKPRLKIYECEIHRVKKEPASVLIGNSPLQSIVSPKAWQSAKSGYRYDLAGKMLYIKVPVKTDSSYSITTQLSE